MLDVLKEASQLCQQYTYLSQEDIEKICDVTKNLPLIADLSKANVFIDCITKEGKQAVVVAEAIPNTAKSVYKNSVVGKFAYEAFEPAVFFTLRTGKNMFLNRAITQEGKVVEQSVVPINGVHNQVIGTLIMEKDISEKIQHQNEMKALSITTEALSEILIRMTENRPIIPEVIGEALFFTKPNGTILYYNPPAMNLVTEMCQSECKAGIHIEHYFPKLKDILHSQEELMMEELKIGNKIFEVKRVNLHLDDEVNGKFIILRDLTELREKERELIVKSVAISEIHHRVKNNLQTVASLLRLQMKRKIPEESKTYLIESLNRVLSIASVYELILSGSSMDEVDIYRLIEKIGNMLVYSEDRENKDITIYYEGSSLVVPSKMAVSVALVINELIQNAMKHAFIGRKEGQIKIIFHHEHKNATVQVMDNGIGISQAASPSLGLDIVRMMVEHDLTGQLDIHGNPEGTVVTVEFPLVDIT